MNLLNEDFVPFQSSRLDTVLNREKIIMPAPLPITVEEELQILERASGALGLPMPKFIEQFDYFITICFPTKHLFKIKHKKLMPHGKESILFSNIAYGDVSDLEQYNFIKWTFDKYIHHLCVYYDIFFEVTSSGNVHCHGRISYNGNKKKTQKDIKTIIYQMFGLSQVKYPRFVDVKPYDFSRWNDYDKKQDKKAYQVTEYPHYTNIIYE